MWAATWDASRLLHFRALHLLCRFVGLPLSADFEAAWSRGCCDRFSVDERVLCEAGVRAVVGCTLVLPKWAPCLSFGLSLICYHLGHVCAVTFCSAAFSPFRRIGKVDF